MYKKFALAVMLLAPVLVMFVDALTPKVTQQIASHGTETADSVSADASLPTEHTDSGSSPAPRGASSFFSEAREPIAGQPMLDPKALAASTSPMLDTGTSAAPRPASPSMPAPVTSDAQNAPLVDPALSRQYLRKQVDGG